MPFTLYNDSPKPAACIRARIDSDGDLLLSFVDPETGKPLPRGDLLFITKQGELNRFFDVDPELMKAAGFEPHPQGGLEYCPEDFNL